MSYKVYPVIKTNDICDDYEVYVNGEKAELNTARVSAYPFNRRWPGHQRGIEQTELINFLSMESDEEVELRIVPKTPSLSVRICPRDIGKNAVINASGEITLKIGGAAHFTVEPCGRTRALHVFVDPVSGYEIDKNDSSLLYFGKGEHDVGDIHLQSGQILFIDEGAVVYATVFAKHAKNIKILGRGILDNSKNRETILYEANVKGNTEAVNNVKRTHTVNLVCCEDVTVDGITIRDSLVYNMDCCSCKNVHISNIKIIGCWRFNSDGVHFSNCTDCSLTNSFLRTYDDSICVRGFANYEYKAFLDDISQEELSFACRDILIKNCTVWNDWGKCLQVGTETKADEIKNVIFEDCRLIHTTYSAIAIWLVDDAKIHDILFKNISVEYDNHILGGAIQNSDSHIYSTVYDPNRASDLVYMQISWHNEYSLIPSDELLGSINGVKISGVSLYSIQKPAFKFFGYNEKSTIENVLVEGLYWNGEPVSKELFEEQTVRNEYTKDIVLCK